MSLVRAAQIETPTKGTPRRSSFLASFVAATPFSLFSPLLREPARNTTVQGAGPQSAQDLQTEHNMPKATQSSSSSKASATQTQIAPELDLMSWSENNQDDGRDVVQIDEQLINPRDSDSDDSDSDDEEAHPADPVNLVPLLYQACSNLANPCIHTVYAFTRPQHTAEIPASNHFRLATGFCCYSVQADNARQTRKDKCSVTDVGRLFGRGHRKLLGI